VSNIHPRLCNYGIGGEITAILFKADRIEFPVK